MRSSRPIRPYGAIGAKWTALSGTSGFLGRPLNNEHDVAGAPGARMEDFTGGTIYWSPATGAHVVHGAILAKYQATGNAAKYRLFVTDETKTPDGIGRCNDFTNGRSIYWTRATSAHLVYGAIRAKWARWAGNAAVLAIPPPMSHRIGGRRNDFQHGSITWASRIRDRHRTLPVAREFHPTGCPVRNAVDIRDLPRLRRRTICSSAHFGLRECYSLRGGRSSSLMM